MNDAEGLASTASGCIRTTHTRGSFYTNAFTTASRFFGQQQRWRPLDRLGRNPMGTVREPAKPTSRGSREVGDLWPGLALLSASLLPRTLACFSLSLLAFSLPRDPLALPAGGEPRSPLLRGGLQLSHL